MITPELQDYIKQARAQGMSDAQIRQNLLAGGWNEGDLTQAGLGGLPGSMSPNMRPQPASQTMTPGMYVQKKSHAGLIISIIVILLFFVLGAWGGYSYYKGLWPFEKEIQEEVQEDIEEVAEDEEIITVHCGDTLDDVRLVKKSELDSGASICPPDEEPGEETPESPDSSDSATTPLPMPTATACVSEFGVIGWYAGDGNAKDIKNAYNGAVKGGIKYVQGVVGQAFSLNGTDAYIEASSWAGNDPTNGGSLSAWVKFNALPSASHIMQIIGKGSDGKDFDLQVNKDNLFRFYVGSGTNVASKTVVKTGVWYHVTGTWDSTGLRMYVNGVLENTNPVANKTRTASGQKLQIGRQPYFPGRYFNGIIDEAMISNRAWTAGEVSKMYKAGNKGVCKPAPATSTSTNTTTTTTTNTNTQTTYTPPAKTYFADPLTLTSVTPASGKVGTQATLNGAGFAKTGNGIWFYSGSYAKATVLNVSSSDGSKLIFAIPTKLAPGAYTLQVNNGNTSLKSSFQFTVTP